jgi:hypothetical protein
MLTIFYQTEPFLLSLSQESAYPPVFWQRKAPVFFREMSLQNTLVKILSIFM